MSGRRAQCLALVTLMAGGAAYVHAAAEPAAGPATYTNVQIVSVDAISRTLVIRNANGVEEKLGLDDNVAGFGDVKAGDRVILSLRSGPGMARVSSIVKSSAPPPRVPANRSPSPVVPRVDNAEVLASEAFTAQVVRLGGQADRVDRVWNTFRSTCSFKPGTPHDGAREWFVVWEGAISADMSSGVCRDLFNQVIDQGEPVKSEMTAAEDVARRILSPGDIRDIRRQYRMDWDGWSLARPKPLEP